MSTRLMGYLAIALVGIVGGCAEMDSGLNDDEALDRRLNHGFYKDGNPPETHYNRIVWQPISHRVAFASNSAQLGRDQAALIDQFLRRVGAKRGEQITVTAGDDGVSPSLPQRRISAIRQYVGARGYVASSVAVVPGTDDVNVVTLSVSRNAAVVPNCPSWDSIMAGQDTSAHRRHFGCMTAQSLGNQVDNINDLLRGRDLGRGDGSALAKGVQDYRTGAAAASTSPTSASTSAPATTK